MITTIGKRIRFIRNLRGMTQKQLGMEIGFDERTADIRIAQYEAGTRTPKEKVIAALASALEVSPSALAVPDLETDTGFMHTLFTLEDEHGLKIDCIDGIYCLTPDKSKRNTYPSLLEDFITWQKEAERFRSGEITKDEYDDWRYNYPKVETERSSIARNARRGKKKEGRDDGNV